jgi:hypothetical protein
VAWGVSAPFSRFTQIRGCVNACYATSKDSSGDTTTIPLLEANFGRKRQANNFEKTEGHHVPGISIKPVNKTTVILTVSRAHGMSVASEYAIFPWDADDFSDPSGYPKVRITDVSELESWAEISGDDHYSI